MTGMSYQDGTDVQLGDVVDVGAGGGQLCSVVVIIPAGEAAPGFDASEWSYLGRGIMLRDEQTFGLLHLEELSHEHLLVHRAQQPIATDRAKPRSG
jgi:hypothetical protein